MPGRPRNPRNRRVEFFRFFVRTLWRELLPFKSDLLSDCFGEVCEQLFVPDEVALDFIKVSTNLRHIARELGLVLDQQSHCRL